MKSSDQFFSQADYAVFQDGLVSNPDYDGERERVRDKLASLHKLLYPEIRRHMWDLHPHWMSQWLVSAYRISPATSRIEVMTLRYSKPEVLIKMMKQELFEDFGHFYANAMLAVRIDKEGFAVELMISEKAWVDGQNLKNRLLDGAGGKSKFQMLLAELGGEHTLALSQFMRQDGRPLGYQQVLRAKASRLVNAGVLGSTIDKYKPGGHDLSLGVRYKPADKRLSKEHIVAEIVDRMEQLYPIYSFASWSPKNDFRKKRHENSNTSRRAR